MTDTQTYLEKHPPARSQFRRKRRATVTGSVVLHTAESRTDVVGGDSGAESVAKFISKRTDAAGSYHSIADSDSRVRVGRFEWEMFGEGTGGNRWALHLSFACKAAQWSTLPEPWVAGAIEQGAIAAAEMCDWINQQRGFKIPPRRISPAEYRNGAAGFVGHGELDPGRRSDPGADFPWEAFLSRYAQLTNQAADVTKPSREDLVIALQRVLLAHGAENLGHTGPNKDGVDGDPGMGTIGDAITIIESLADTAGTLRQTNHDLTTQVATLTIKHAEEVEALRAALGSGTVSYRRSDGLNDAVREVEALYQTHRGYDPTGAPLYTGAEIHEWRLDLHNKIYELGVDVHPTLAYIDWALANEDTD